MPPPELQSRARHGLHVLLCCAALLAGCAEDDPPHKAPTTQGAALKPEGPAPQAGATEPHTVQTWRTLSPAGQMRVSPRFSPSGDLLATAGWGGVGIFVQSVATGEQVFAAHTFKGLATFGSDDSLCLWDGDHGRLMRPVEGGLTFAEDAPGCSGPEWLEGPGALVMRNEHVAIYHNSYLGTVTRVLYNGEHVVIEDQGAWGVAASPDGERIAYSVGTLADPELHVYDPKLGRWQAAFGAQPSWLPDGKHVLFMATEAPWPEDAEEFAADLFLYNIETQQLVQLTDTPSIAEVEPALSPDGTMVAIANWQDGTVRIGPVTVPVEVKP